MKTDPHATILTIEDDAAVRQGIAAYLEDRGFKVLEAENGRRGLQVFRRQRTDLILVDLRMPEVDGLEVLAAVTEESPDTPVAEGLQSEAYRQVDDRRRAGLKVFCDIFGFYDVVLIDPEGDVVFTVAKESDLGTNLVNGPLSQSGLAEAFQQGKTGTTFVDFAWYEPSNEPASFVATPLKDGDGQLIGVAAFQVSLKEINAIMQERAGLGREYLTGLVKLKDRLLILLHIDKILGEEEMKLGRAS